MPRLEPSDEDPTSAASPPALQLEEVTHMGLQKRAKGRRSVVFGVIGVVWGGLIILNMLLSGLPGPDNPYGAGQLGALVLAFALVGAGTWELRKS
jgi:hypothetical protein